MIPPKIQRLITNYLEEGAYPGEFLKGVLTNDLRKALLNGDYEEIKELYSIHEYILLTLPTAVRGSRKAYEYWLSTK